MDADEGGLPLIVGYLAALVTWGVLFELRNGPSLDLARSGYWIGWLVLLAILLFVGLLATAADTVDGQAWLAVGGSLYCLLGFGFLSLGYVDASGSVTIFGAAILAAPLLAGIVSLWRLVHVPTSFVERYYSLVPTARGFAVAMGAIAFLGVLLSIVASIHYPAILAGGALFVTVVYLVVPAILIAIAVRAAGPSGRAPGVGATAGASESDSSPPVASPSPPPSYSAEPRPPSDPTLAVPDRRWSLGGVIAAVSVFFLGILLYFALLTPGITTAGGLILLGILVGVVALGTARRWKDPEEAAALFFVLVSAWLPGVVIPHGAVASTLTPQLAGLMMLLGIGLAVDNLRRASPRVLLTLGGMLVLFLYLGEIAVAPAHPWVYAPYSWNGLSVFTLVPLAVAAAAFLLGGAQLPRRIALAFGGSALAACVAGAYLGGVFANVPNLVTYFGSTDLTPFAVVGIPGLAAIGILAIAGVDPRWYPANLHAEYVERVRRHAYLRGHRRPEATGLHDDPAVQNYYLLGAQNPTITILASGGADVRAAVAPLFHPPEKRPWRRDRGWDFARIGKGPSFDATGPRFAGPGVAPPMPLTATLQFRPRYRNDPYTLFCPPALSPSALAILASGVADPAVREAYARQRGTAALLILVDPKEAIDHAMEFDTWVWQFLTYLAEFTRLPVGEAVRMPVAVVALPGLPPQVGVRDLLGRHLAELPVTLEHRFDVELLRYYALDSQGALHLSGATSRSDEPRDMIELLRWLTGAARKSEALDRATNN